MLIIINFKIIKVYSFSSVQLFSHAWLFATPWLAAGQASLSITNSQSLLKLTSIASVMPSNHLILCCPLLLPPSILPSIRIFSNELVLHHQVAQVLELQLQHQSFQWSPLGWTGWISLQSKDSHKSSPAPQFKSINSLVLSFLYTPTLTSIQDYWKNHSLDYMDLCWQSNVSVF